MSDGVLIAVDPHKAHNTLVVLDPATRRPVGEAEFANTSDGYRDLRRFARQWQDRRWAVEGCHGAGRSLAQRLVADGEPVAGIPAKLAARVRVFSRGHGRKTDRDDAVSIGLAALQADGVLPVTPDGTWSRSGSCATAGRSSPLPVPRRSAGCTGCWPSSSPAAWAARSPRPRPQPRWPGSGRGTRPGRSAASSPASTWPASAAWTGGSRPSASRSPGWPGPPGRA